LSAEVQLLFHTCYKLRSHQQRDANLLLRLIGDWMEPPAAALYDVRTT
jgi:hypothetical protein